MESRAFYLATRRNKNDRGTLVGTPSTVVRKVERAEKVEGLREPSALARVLAYDFFSFLSFSGRTANESK